MDLAQSPYCLEELDAAGFVFHINEAILRDSGLGTSSGATILVVVGLPRQGEESDEAPHVSLGGVRVEGEVIKRQVIPVLRTAASLAGNAIRFPWGTNKDGVGLPDLDLAMEHLAGEIEMFSHNTMRDYGLALVRPHCGVVYLNGRQCRDGEERIGMLERIIKVLEQTS